jgi:hypothetical protein
MKNSNFIIRNILENITCTMNNGANFLKGVIKLFSVDACIHPYEHHED